MPIEVEVDGQVYEFPDDATDAEIQSALGGQSTPEPSIRPMASHEPTQPSAPRTWGDEAIDVGKGVGQGLLRLGANMSEMLTGAPADEYYKPYTQPRNTAQRVGNIAADIGTAAIPMARAARIARGAPAVVRGLINAGAGAGVSAAQGNDPRAGALGAVLPQAAEIGTKAATGVARAITGAGDDVALSALRNRALPGLMRDGTSRAAARMSSATDDVKASLAGTEGDVPVRMAVAGPKMGESFAPLRRADPKFYEEGREAAARIRATVGTSKPAREFFDVAESSRIGTLGKRDPSSVVERAASADMRDRLGRSVPSVAGRVGKVSELAPVVEAYAQHGGHGLIDPSGLPSLTARLVAATVNRTVPPLTQGAYNLSKIGQSDMARLALMSMLEQSMKDR